jgi:hypothetical protein
MASVAAQISSEIVRQVPRIRDLSAGSDRTRCLSSRTASWSPAQGAARSPSGQRGRRPGERFTFVAISGCRAELVPGRAWWRP